MIHPLRCPCGHDDTGHVGPKEHGFLLLLSAPTDCNKETDAEYTGVEEEHDRDRSTEEGRCQSDRHLPGPRRSR